MARTLTTGTAQALAAVAEGMATWAEQDSATLEEVVLAYPHADITADAFTGANTELRERPAQGDQYSAEARYMAVYGA